MSRLRARVVVSGRVQGVWFRESTRRRADELGLAGWVRNLSDGRVEAVFEGPDDRVRAAIEFVKVGPPLARVRNVDVEEEPPAATVEARDPAGFEIR